jgi:hypothetical protein
LKMVGIKWLCVYISVLYQKKLKEWSIFVSNSFIGRFIYLYLT